MATTNKIAIASSQQSTECCMCGDWGLPNELFLCKVCQLRSQHRYCSNLYPKVESYQVCNWCLSHDSKEKSQNSSNSSSSNKNNSEDDSRNNKRPKRNSSSENYRGAGIKTQRGNLQFQVNRPIKKPKSPETERSPSTRRKIISQGRSDERLKRTRSEDIVNNSIGITRQVFRNKVRRYKLLDEVSS
ncbi:hypothetical protein K2173_008003 [Erythroxylum novogranatense]|uniref:PHD-type zinc finger plants domain-containing protein n=1 Tax=Erythroxylum novogranatense TaxID=1862640 RepID=A0AAV8T8C6_9ROSI|nr:hypothetical protein K2173_008003 [Erythroxylum novogranatense]